MTWQKLVTRVATAATVMGMVATAGAGSLPAAAASEIFEGTVRTLAADTVGRGSGAVGTAGHDHSGQDHPHGDAMEATNNSVEPGATAFTGHSEDAYRQVLVVDDDTAYFLKGKKVVSDRKVRISGSLDGDELTVATATPIGPAAGPAPAAANGTTRVLVMMVSWGTLAPDDVTQASAAQQMFTDSNSWFRDASYGVLGQTGDVTPWMRIEGPANNACYAGHNTTMAQAKTQAQALGYDVNSYDNWVVYHPNAGGLPGNDCGGFAGWAYVGSTGTWLNGYMDRRVTVHEQGHNYGLWHSHSYLCTGGGVTSGCTFSEYGDPWDAMGSSGYVGHFSASQKDLLGWWNAGRSVDLSQGGIAQLVPMASDGLGAHVARVTAPGTSRSYWAEYRQAIDYDSALTSSATNGVLLHVADPSIMGDSGSGLFDASPVDGVSVNTATLKSGQEWISPEGLRFRVSSVSASSATLTVTTTDEPPAPPISVKKTGFPAGNYVEWTANLEADWYGFNVYRRTSAANPWVKLNTSRLTVSNFLDTTAPIGVQQLYGVTKVDAGGHESSMLQFTNFRPTAPAGIQQNNVFVTYSGTWATQTLASFSGGTTAFSSTANSKAFYRYHGKQITFTSTKGPNRGTAEIWYDGVKKATINLKSASMAYRNVVWRSPLAAGNGWHLLQIKVLGTGRVDVDAYQIK